MSRTRKRIEGKRINLKLATDVRNRMEVLRDETGALSLTELVGKSLAVYDYLWTQKKGGAKLIIEDSDGKRELVLL